VRATAAVRLLLCCVFLAAPLTGCSGGGDPDLRSGETRFEGSSFRFAVPEGWRAVPDDDPSVDEQVNIFEAVGDRGLRVSISRQRLRDRIPLEKRVERAYEDRPGTKELTPLVQVDGGIDGEEAWTFGTTTTMGSRTEDVVFDHASSEYDVAFAAPVDLFPLRRDRFRRIVDTWRFH
jgi:hypothetical protein